MTDLPSDFWGGWIAIITIVSFAALGWLIFSIYFSAPTAEEETDGPTWDETLKEGAQPAPMWWFWFILALMVLTVLYLMLYPGLGSFSGALKWSQGGRLEQSMHEYAAEFGGVRKLVAEAQLTTLQSDAAMMRSAQRIYDRQCAVCHGYDAAGQANLFPNLIDEVWQWGGTTAQIEQSIRQGRRAVMVGWLQLLGGDDGVRRVADYVKIIGSEAAGTHPGRAPYMQFCVACHGLDGVGNVALGAPNLADDVWLYGDSDEALYESIAVGRNGMMPAFAGRLDDTQIRLLVAWLSR